MRFLLLIPVFVLFLSNVPFIQEMPMGKVMAMIPPQKEKKCCKKSAEKQPMACHSQPESKPKPMACHDPVKGSCQPTGVSCVCICVFQFTAPTQDIKLFQFTPVNTLAGRTGYLQLKWKDPHIASPGQPPDWI